MKGTTPRCPNLVFQYTAFVPCGYEGYEVVDKAPFTKDSGLDPLAVKVRCRRCKYEYYVFPAVTYSEVGREKI